MGGILKQLVQNPADAGLNCCISVLNALKHKIFLYFYLYQIFFLINVYKRPVPSNRSARGLQSPMEILACLSTRLVIFPLFFPDMRSEPKLKTQKTAIIAGNANE